MPSLAGAVVEAVSTLVVAHFIAVPLSANCCAPFGEATTLDSSRQHGAATTRLLAVAVVALRSFNCWRYFGEAAIPSSVPADAFKVKAAVATAVRRISLFVFIAFSFSSARRPSARRSDLNTPEDNKPLAENFGNRIADGYSLACRNNCPARASIVTAGNRESRPLPSSPASPAKIGFSCNSVGTAAKSSAPIFTEDSATRT